MATYSLTQIDEVEELEQLLLEVEIRDLVVYNDDVNTFEDVIQWFVEICDHQLEQAEQCAYLIHYTGKCIVKNGTYEFLEPRCSALLQRGLTAEIK
jgi:ATP-dependent Clp protease adaptor protein ClpS